MPLSRINGFTDIGLQNDPQEYTVEVHCSSTR